MMCHTANDTNFRRSNRFLFVFAALIAASLMTLTGGCAHQRALAPAPSPTPAPHKKARPMAAITVPAGVDSDVAVAATIAAREVLVGWLEDSLAQDLYREGQQRSEEGRPLRDAVRKSRMLPQELPPSDTSRSIGLFQSGDSSALRGDKALGRRSLSAFTPDDLAKYPEVARRKAAILYEQARDLYEQALELNPWNREAHDALLAIYKDLISLHRSLEDVNAELHSLQVYTDLYGDRYARLARMAQLYAESGDTLQSLIAYRRAEDALLTWAPSSPSSDSVSAQAETGLDSVQYRNWLAFIQYQCFFETALGLSISALTDLYRLRNSCRPSVDSALSSWAQEQLDWLAWDNGNLATAKMRTEIYGHWNSQEWQAARKAIAVILPLLENPDAIFEMEYGAATLDFGYLDQFEAGLTGLRKLLVQKGFAEVNSNLDSTLREMGEGGFAARMAELRKSAPKKTTELLDYYGNACVDYGVRVEKQTRDKERAYVYYYQAALVPCRKQADALSYLADLSRNQPDRAITFGETAVALDSVVALDPESRGSLYETLCESYRRKNDRMHTEFYYQALRAVKNGSAK
jgi:tetratricopeptide (TPR) repeat protein